MEGCRLLAEARGPVERDELREWGSRHARNKKEKKGLVEPEKGAEKEEEKLETPFFKIYNFLEPVPAVNVSVFIPAELPLRYSINFVRGVIASPVIASVVSTANFVSVVSSANFVPAPSPCTDYSVVSSANFVPAPSTCIGKN